jgi:hypothetical protein
MSDTGSAHWASSSGTWFLLSGGLINSITQEFPVAAMLVNGSGRNEPT